MSSHTFSLVSLLLALCLGSWGCDGGDDGPKDNGGGDGGGDDGDDGDDGGGDDGGGDDGGGDDSGGDDGGEPVDSDGDGTPDEDDCEPDNADAFPGGTEICNGIDDDCDGTVDNDATDATTWYGDGDGDGYGGADMAVEACEAPPRHYAVADDCNDADLSIHPGAAEIPYDTIDQDCVDGDLCDVDLDGFVAEECGGPDCNDDNSSTYPGAPEAGLLTGDVNCDGDMTTGGSLADAEISFLGENEDDNAGFTVSGAGDVDGDGLDDLLVSAHLADGGPSSAGRVYLFFGSTISASTSSVWSLGDADVIFVGEETDDYAGYAVSTAGDVDNDGLDDIIIGVHRDDDGGNDAGKASIFLGSTIAGSSSSSIDLAEADHVLIGEDAGDAAGRAVSSAGDVDNDGLDDVLVGAYFNSEAADRAGKAYVVLGSSLTRSTTMDLADADYGFLGEREVDAAGTTVASAGDIDGDGFDDLLVGAFANDKGGTNAGVAYVWLGKSLPSRTPATLELVDADVRLIGEADNDWAGISFAVLGDLDGDTYSEIAVGAMYSDKGGEDAGSIYVVRGSEIAMATDTAIPLDTAWVIITGANEEDGAGFSLDAADVDGDGMRDLLVGAYLNSDNGTLAGASYIVLGSTIMTASSTDWIFSLNDSEYTFVGDERGDQSGRSVSFVGDVDGNGRTDLLVGASQSDDGGDDAGKAALILNRL